MALSTTDMGQIVQAILSSPQMRFITRLMQQDVAAKQAGAEKYAALASSQRRLRRHVADIARRTTAAEQRETGAERAARLDTLAARFPGVVDVEEERHRCLYSAGGDMNDDEFDEHCAAIEQYAARSVEIAPLVAHQRAHESRRTAESERYGAEIHQRSVEIYDASVAAGRPKTPEQCWQEAEQQKTSGAS